MKRPVILILCSLFPTLPLAARTWTQASTGKEIEAELITVEEGKAHLRLPGGRVGQVEVISLSLEDQQYISSLESESESESESDTGAAGESGGSDWPAFRGADGSGISPDENLLESWPERGPEKRWVYDEAGMGYSGFSVVDGRLYTLGTRGEDLSLICVDTAAGTEQWSTAFAVDDKQGYNAGWGHGPRSTPTVSDGLVYATGPKGTVGCFDAESGEEKWTVHMVEDFDGEAGGWGYAASPLIDGDRLLLAPGGEAPGMVCLDKKNGEVIWKADGLAPGKAEYATIVPADINGDHQYIKLFQTELVGVDAESGDVLWRSPWEGGRVAVIPTPIVDDNEIYVTAGYGAGSKLVKVGPDYETEDVWKNTTMKNHHGGVIKVGDHLYGFSDGAGLICQDWESGELVWNEKGRYTTKGSVHVADGHLYALNERDGTLLLVEATPDGFEQKGQFQLEPQSENRHPKGKIWTHPLVVGGQLYLRDQETIVCYDVSVE